MEYFIGTKLRNIKPKETVEWLSDKDKQEYRALIKTYQGLFMNLSQAINAKRENPKESLDAAQMKFMNDKVHADIISDDVIQWLNFTQNQLDSIEREYTAKLIEMAPHCLYAFHEVMNPSEIPDAQHHKMFIDSLMAVEAGELGTLLIASPAGSAKMLDVETHITMSDGAMKRLDDVVVGDSVMSHRGRGCKVQQVHIHPNTAALRITFHNGRSIVSSHDHTHFTARGMMRADEVKVGDRFGTVRGLGVRDTSGLTRGDVADIVNFCRPKRGVDVDHNHAITNQYITIPQAIFKLDNRRLYKQFIIPYLSGGLSAQQRAKGKIWGKTMRHPSAKFREQFMTLLDRLDIEYFSMPHQERITFLTTTRLRWCGGYERPEKLVAQGLDKKKIIEAQYYGRRLAMGALTYIDQSMMEATRQEKWGLIAGLWSGYNNSRGTLALRHIEPGEVDLTKQVKCTFPVMDLPLCQQVTDILSSLDITTRTIKGDGNFVVSIKKNEHMCRLFQNAPIGGVARSTFTKFIEDGTLVPDLDSDLYSPLTVVKIEAADTCDMRCLTIEHDKTFLTDTCITHNTSYTSRSFAQWFLGRNPSKLILAPGNSQGFMENQISKPNRDAMKSDIYHRIFPDVQIDPQARSAEFWRLDGHKGSYKCVGAGGAVAGQRADIILGDDLFRQANEALSETIRERIKSWVAGDLMSRLKPGGKLVFVNTIFHSEDAISHLINQCKIQQKSGDNTLPSPTRVIRLEAQCTDKEADPLGREVGEYIWPEYFPPSHWETLKANLSAQQWACIYQNHPIDLEGENIAESDFKTYTMYPENIEGREVQVLKTVGMVDTALKASERADFTVLTIFRQGMDKKWYVLDMWREQKGLSAIAEAIVDMHKKWDLNYVAVEAAGMGFQLVSEYSGKIPVPLFEVTIHGKGSKEFRAEKVFPYIKTGMILFPENMSWMQEVKKELMGFPYAKYDDIVDTYSILVDHEFSYAAGGTKKLIMG